MPAGKFVGARERGLHRYLNMEAGRFNMSIHERALAALRQSRSPDIRGLTVVQDRSSVVLRGQVRSFYHKQLAQELVKNEIGGTEVVNEAEVIYRHEGG